MTLKMFAPEHFVQEPCDGCDIVPSVHMGHGSFSCEACFNARWCPECHGAKHAGECPDLMIRAARKLSWRETAADLEIACDDETYGVIE